MPSTDMPTRPDDRPGFVPRTPEELLGAAITIGRARRRLRRRRNLALALGSALLVSTLALVLTGAARGGPSSSSSRSGVAVSTVQRARAVDVTVRRALGVVIPSRPVAAKVAAGAAPAPVISNALRGQFPQWQGLLVAGLEVAERSGTVVGPTAVVSLGGARHDQLQIGGTVLGIDSLQGQVGDAAHQVWSASLLLFGSNGGDLVLVGPCGPAVGAPSMGGQVEQTCPGVEVDFSSAFTSGSASVSTFQSHRTVGWVAIGSGGSRR